MEGWAGIETILFLWAVVHPVGVVTLRPQLVHGEAGEGDIGMCEIDMYRDGIITLGKVEEGSNKEKK